MDSCHCYNLQPNANTNVAPRSLLSQLTNSVSIQTFAPAFDLYSPHYHEGSPVKPYCRSLIHVALLVAGPVWSAIMTMSPSWIFLCFADQFLLWTSFLLHIPQHPTQEGYTAMRALDMFGVFLCATANMLPALYKSGGLLLVTLTLLVFLLMFCIFVHYSKQGALFLGAATVMLIVLAVVPAQALTYISLACFILAGLLYTFPDNDMPNTSTAWRIFQLQNANSTLSQKARPLFASHDAVQWLGAIAMLCMLRVNYCLIFE